MANDSVQPHASGSLERLLAQRDFVVAVARAVLADASLAEDVAQQTLLTAWSARIDASRQWLATVARRLASNARRGDVRRERRERATFGPTEGPSPQRILELEDERKRLVAAVLELAEPLRTTVLLRFYDDLPPRAIAAKQGVPVETIRTRLKRAQELLRERLLPADEATRRERVQGLLVLAGARTFDGVLVATGGAIVATKAWIAAAAVVVVVVGLGWWTAVDGTDGERSVANGPVEVEALERRQPENEHPGVASSAEQQRSEVVAASQVAWTDEWVIPRTVRGRVVTEAGEPIRGARVRIRTPQTHDVLTTIETNAVGDFAAPVTPHRCDDETLVDFRAVGYVATERRAPISGSGEVELGTIRMATAGRLRGRVVDERGRPIVGALVQVAPTSSREAWTFAWSIPEQDPHATTTDERGGFAFVEIRPDWYDVVAISEGSRPSRVDRIAVPRSADADDLELVLRDATAGEWIDVLVLDERGAPLAGRVVTQNVQAGPGSSAITRRTDSNGRILFFDPSRDPRAQQVAQHEWHVHREPPDGRSVSATWKPGMAQPVVLKLPESVDRTLRVVDASTGMPIAGWVHVSVWCGDDRRLLGRDAGFDGTATIGVPPRVGSITVTADGHADATLDAVDFRREGVVEIKLVPVPTIRGRLVSEGRAVVHARIDLVPADESRGIALAQSDAGADGSFRLAIPEGQDDVRCLLEVRPFGFAPQTLGPKTVAQWLADGESTIELDQGGRIEGLVRATDGSTVAGTLVSAIRCDPRFPWFTIRVALASTDGTYAFDRLEPGTWRVDARTDWTEQPWERYLVRQAPGAPNVSVTRDATTRFDVVRPTEAARVVLEGICRIDGEASPSWSIDVLDPKAALDPLAPDAASEMATVAGTSLSPDGEFRLVLPRAGRVLVVADDAFCSLTRVVDLAVGTTFTRFDVATGRLEGTLDPPREARIDVELRIDAQTVARAIAIAGPDGRWSTGPLVAGRSTVRVDGELLATVDVVPGKVTTVGGTKD
jgi:RNA polymerase sigma factor (sigma-70 family)